MSARFVFITGGVLSSIGKGITTASIGALMKFHGLKVTAVKLDPYLNVDAGTMNPYQHGEVFVTVDGAETDLDLGHYERFLDTNLSSRNNVTSGRVYASVIEKERRGAYLGSTVQIVPHVIDEIKSQILALRGSVDVVLVEVGGTVGDIESQPFLEAIRQIGLQFPDETLFLHLTLVPHLATVDELKTKPSQHSVQELRRIGIQPDIIGARSVRPLTDGERGKIALFASLPVDRVISVADVSTIYEVPLMLARQNLDKILLARLRLKPRRKSAPGLRAWESMVRTITAAPKAATIAVVGKYVKLHDAYKSIAEALLHAATATGRRLVIRWVDSERVTRKTAAAELAGADGILVPGGFGVRGIEGMVEAVRHARENNIPFFGICLGLQISVIEIARHLLGLAADSREFSPRTPHPVIDLMEEQKQRKRLGGTMRLGSCECALKPGSLAASIYRKTRVRERHRHRYEVNSRYLARLAAVGYIASGRDRLTGLTEIMELKKHPFFVAAQFHPEFQSRPARPHPLFLAFLRKAVRA